MAVSGDSSTALRASRLLGILQASRAGGQLPRQAVEHIRRPPAGSLGGVLEVGQGLLPVAQAIVDLAAQTEEGRVLRILRYQHIEVRQGLLEPTEADQDLRAGEPHRTATRPGSRSRTLLSSSSASWSRPSWSANRPFKARASVSSPACARYFSRVALAVARSFVWICAVARRYSASASSGRSRKPRSRSGIASAAFAMRSLSQPRSSRASMSSGWSRSRASHAASSAARRAAGSRASPRTRIERMGGRAAPGDASSGG